MIRLCPFIHIIIFGNNKLIKKFITNERITIAQPYIALSRFTMYIDSATKQEDTNTFELVNGQVHLAPEDCSQFQDISIQNKKVFEVLDDKVLGIFSD